MPPPNYVSISVPRELAERLKRARLLLASGGVNSLPTWAKPVDPSIIGSMTVLEIAAAVIEHYCNGVNRKTELK